MRKKVLPSILLSLTFILFFNISAYSQTQSDDTELNWYFVAKGKDITPEPAKESISFLSDYDGYYIGNTKEKVLYLTFDEGYEKGNTASILDTLKELKVPAAFFVVKPFIDTQPELVKRMVNEGHLVCNHSNHHPSMASITDNNEFKKEFTDVEKSFKDLTGKEMPKYFRPPMGKYSKNSLIKTKELGYKTIFWSFAYRDWLVDYQPNPAEAINKIKNGMHPGCIILLHSVSDTNTAILKQVIKELQDEGYKFKSLNEL